MADPNAYEDISFWDRFSDSWHTIIEGCNVLINRPVLMLPLVLCFALLSFICFWGVHELWKMRVMVNANPAIANELQEQVLWIGLGFVFLFTIVQSLCTFIQLEIIQQIETENRVDIFKAFNEAIFKDLIKGFPIVISWLLLNIVSGSGRRRRRRTFAVRGFNSFIRMTIFFTLPAIAWEDKDFISAIKKGFRLVKIHFTEFISGMIQFHIVMTIACLPIICLLPLVPVLSHPNTANTLLPMLAALIILYILFIYCLCFNIEQMFAATYYMWNRKWEKAVVKASVAKEPLPKIYDIPKPSLLDNVPDLL